MPDTLVYVREAMWNEVLKLAERHGMSIIEAYKDELHTRYPETIAIIYKKTVFRMLADATKPGYLSAGVQLIAAHQAVRTNGARE